MWKFLEIQILFTLPFIFLCSVVINGTSITTTPKGEMNNVEFDEAGECSNNQSHGPRERMILKGKIYIAKINEAGEYLKRLDEVTKCLSVMNLTRFYVEFYSIF
ncbi:Protein furry [Dirofilaria immitis]